MSQRSQRNNQSSAILCDPLRLIISTQFENSMELSGFALALVLRAWNFIKSG
jgi:hypothetical protein